MKRTSIVLILYMIIIMGTNAQVSLSPFAGFSNPLGSFAQDTSFAGRGLDLGLGLSYVSKKWGIGLDLGQFSNPFNQKLSSFKDQLNIASVLTSSNDNWSTIYGAIGPIIKFGGEKFHVEVSPKMGLSKTQLPEFNLSYDSELLSKSLNILSSDADKDVSNILSSFGIKLQYSLTDRFGINLQANLLSNALFNDNKLKYTYKELTDFDGDGILSESEIIESPNFEKEICQKLNVINTGIGLSYSFGGGDKKAVIEEKVECENTILASPYNGEKFNIGAERRPAFSWTNKSTEVKSYRINIYKNNEIVFSERTKKQNLNIIVN
ncbi:MAG: hypothetical protein R2766_01300 [Saprospiraceae bacterium]